MLRFFPSMGGHRNGVLQVTYSGAKLPSWQGTARRNWLYRVISICLNSIPPHRTNSSTNARRWDSHSKCCAAANNGTGVPAAKRGLVNNSARRDFTVTGRIEYQFDGTLFHLGSFIFFSSNDADRSLKLAGTAAVRDHPWIYRKLTVKAILGGFDAIDRALHAVA